jgi:hypothetical protein
MGPQGWAEKAPLPHKPHVRILYREQARVGLDSTAMIR